MRQEVSITQPGHPYLWNGDEVVALEAARDKVKVMMKNTYPEKPWLQNFRPFIVPVKDLSPRPLRYLKNQYGEEPK